MRTKRLVVFTPCLVFGVTLADANPVSAPSWTPSLTESQSQASGAATVVAPTWAPAEPSSDPVAFKAPVFSTEAAMGSTAIAAPSWAGDWNAVAGATAAGQPARTSYPADPAANALPMMVPNGAATTVAIVADANPFVAAPTAAAPLSLPNAPASNPFELPAAVAPQAVAPAAANSKPFGLEAPQAQPAGKGVAVAAPQGPDVRALRYYASGRDLVRVGAEIRRLKALYPNWQPPDDLFAPVGGLEEQPLWDLHALGNYGEIRRRIAALQASHPQWRPSSDLLAKLESGETRARIAAASSAGAWNQVIGHAATSKDVLVCANMDTLWRVGEALVRTSKLAEGFDLYHYVLSSCSDPHERQATFQKASLLLPSKGLDALMPLAASLDEQINFANIRFDQLRGKMGAIASGDQTEPLDQDELEQFSHHIETTRSAADATLFGWYLYQLENFEDAAAWFKAASQISKDPKPLEGYILSLRNLEENEPAEELAYKSRKKSPEINKVYVEIVAEQLTDADRDAESAISTERLKRFEDAVDDSKSPLGAQAIGWYCVDDKDLACAKTWFDKSVDWQPTEGGVVGQAVVAARAKRMSELAQIKAAYLADFPALKEFKVWKANKKAKYAKKQYKKVSMKTRQPKSFLARLVDGS